MGVSCAFSLDSSGKKPQLRNPWVPGQLTPGPQGIQESLRYLYLCYFLCSICQTLAHTLSSYLCLFTNASTGEVGHARDKKLKGSSSKMFTHKMHWQEQRQSSQRKSSQAAPRPSRARRAATKKPIAYVEASEESEYEYDSVEDEHYEGNDDVEIDPLDVWPFLPAPLKYCLSPGQCGWPNPARCSEDSHVACALVVSWRRGMDPPRQ